MARFDANGTGTILKFCPTVEIERNPLLGGSPAAGRVYTLHFDEVTNAGIVTAYQANPSQFTMPGGTLIQTPSGGSPAEATINPPSPYYSAFLNAEEIMARLNGGQYAPTQEELSQIAAAAFRGIGTPL